MSQECVREMGTEVPTPPSEKRPQIYSVNITASKYGPLVAPREGRLRVESNGRSLSVDDIARGYEKLFEIRYTHGSITFMGVSLQQDPSDAFAISDLLWRVRPSLLIELGTSGGGGALFYARIMRGYDPDAQVLTIDPASASHKAFSKPLVDWNHEGMRRFCPHCKAAKDELLWKNAVKFHRDYPTSEASLALARKMAREAKGPVLVMEDSSHAYKHVRENMRAFADFVTPGSYLIVQDTRYGNMEGPSVAVGEFLIADKRFVQDRRPEYLLITQHSGGYLRRLEEGEEIVAADPLRCSKESMDGARMCVEIPISV